MNLEHVWLFRQDSCLYVTYKFKTNITVFPLQPFSFYFLNFMFDLKAAFEKEKQFTATKTVIILFILQGVMIFFSACVSFISLAFQRRFQLILVRK